MTIKLRYTSIDGYTKTASFKTLNGARAFAHKWVGEHAEIGSCYAVSADGVGKITVVEGTSLQALFGDVEVAPRNIWVVGSVSYDTYEAAKADAEALWEDGYRVDIEQYRMDEEGNVFTVPALLCPLAYPVDHNDDMPF